VKPSAELRWFYRQQLPAEVKDWFCSAKLCKEEATTRTDQYLVFPGSNEVGAKVRDGIQLEIKTRTKMPEPFSLATGATVGRRDAWMKWKLQDSAVAGRLATLEAGSPHWVTVIKKRWLRKFRVDPAGNIEETNPDATEDERCRAELTELDVRGSHWWTLAFDSFGPGNRAAELEQVARHFLKMLPHGLALTERDSMAYPEWLNRLAG
jgi:hypothetical protein